MFNLKLVLLIGLFIFVTTQILVEETDISKECTLVEDLANHPTLHVTVTDETFDNGAYGEVFANDENTKAIKKINLNNELAKIVVQREIKAMKALSGVVGIVSFDKDEKCYYNGEDVYIIMPLQDIDLTTFLVDESEKEDYELAHCPVWKVYASNYIVNLVVHLHSLNWLHLDLKADNLLEEDVFTINLADFGASELVDPITTEVPYPYFQGVGRRGTPNFLAPEISSSYRFYRETDIYALAVVLLEIWYVKDVSTYKYLANIENIKTEFAKCKNNTYSETDMTNKMFCTFIYPVIEKMYVEDLTSRIKGDELLNEMKVATTNAINYLNQEVIDLQQKIAADPENENVEYWQHKIYLSDVTDFTEYYIEMKANDLNENQPLKEFMLKTNAPFFEALSDRGAKLLGFTIDAFLNKEINLSTPIPVQEEEERLII